MIKLTDLLKEITEAKQVGNLYHFTPLSNLKKILETRYIFSNEEGYVSTSIRPNMETSYLQNMKTKSIARLMFDGDKISTKYKIRPFSYDGAFNPDNPEDLGEEQIMIPGDRFNFIPYLKRIDIFLNKKETVNPKMLELLEKANIPYKVYQGTPISNIPYNQPKTGNPEDINIENIPEKKTYTKKEMYYPNMKTTFIKVYANLNVLNNTPSTQDKGILAGISPEYPNYYLIASRSDYGNNRKWVNSKGEKLNTKIIPIPMFNDPKWRETWKKVIPPDNYFNERLIKDSYILIPKNEID
jgi:hypothetical protein